MHATTVFALTILKICGTQNSTTQETKSLDQQKWKYTKLYVLSFHFFLKQQEKK